MNKIICGDSLDVLKTFEENSIDSIICDPPYGLSFMGKKWDYEVPSVDIWKECLRVLKPGGYLLSFAGTRTQHRMAVNIEDAGFEIRDMIAWVYGSGFPKSLNISKAIDKREGVEHPKNTLISGNRSMSNGNYTRHKMDIQSDSAKQYEGWGTSLKPALEPITVARKPLSEKTVAENVLKHGTGGINIDESRVGNDLMINQPGSTNPRISMGNGWQENAQATISEGRFPANFIHDGSDEVVSLFPDTKSGKMKQHIKGGTFNVFSKQYPRDVETIGDSGSAARFFYCAKASKADRDEGLEEMEEVRHSDRVIDDGAGGDNPRNRTNQPRKNFHPTVKPTKLMQYLVKLVTPKGGTVLDPFMGSGSTGKACRLEGFDFIGIELDSEYVEIAKARISAVDKLPLF